MNGFLVAAAGMLVALIPCGIVIARGDAAEALVAFDAITGIIVMVLVLLAQGLHRSGEFELGVVLGALMLGSGLVFARFVERGL